MCILGKRNGNILEKNENENTNIRNGLRFSEKEINLVEIGTPRLYWRARSTIFICGVWHSVLETFSARFRCRLWTLEA